MAQHPAHQGLWVQPVGASKNLDLFFPICPCNSKPRPCTAAHTWQTRGPNLWASFSTCTASSRVGDRQSKVGLSALAFVSMMYLGVKGVEVRILKSPETISEETLKIGTCSPICFHSFFCVVSELKTNRENQNGYKIWTAEDPSGDFRTSLW